MWNSSFELIYDSKQLRKNKEYYKETRKTACQSVQDCIKDAIMNGNHVQFAIMFIHKEEWERAKRFSSWCRMLEDQNRIKISEISFYESGVWRNPEISPSNMKNISDSSISMWKNGIRGIPRDNLVQLAFYMGLNTAQTNDLLFRMGMRCLYPLDIIDAIEMFYLDYYYYEHDTKTEYVSKLKTVKREINSALAEISQEGVIWIKDKNTENPKFRLLHNGRIALDVPKELKQMKEEFRKNVRDGEADSAIQGVALTEFMTLYFKNRLTKASSISSFLQTDEFGKYPVFTERYYGYLKRTWDYLRDWRSYEKNLKQSGWTLAGENIGYDESDDNQTDVMQESVKKMLKYLAETDSELKKEEKKEEEKKEEREKDEKKYYEMCMRTVRYIETLDVLQKDMKERDFNKKKKYSVTRDYIEGLEKHGVPVKWKKKKDGSYAPVEIAVAEFRGAWKTKIIIHKPKKKGDKKAKTDNQRAKGSKNASSVEKSPEEELAGFIAKAMDNKKSIMEYAIATGHEEELGYYLTLAGYWKKDWYRDLSSKGLGKTPQNEIDQKMSFEGPGGFGLDNEFFPDQLDAQFLYAMGYRDALIDEYCDSCKDIEKTDLRNQLCRQFPMRELLTIVSRDISYAYTVCEHPIYCGSDYEQKSEGAMRNYENSFEDMRTNMLFPIEWFTERKKYSFDRDCNPYYEKDTENRNDDDREIQ